MEKKIKSYPGKIVLPGIIYFEDYETNNPLGSHKGISKCGVIYFSVPVLPPEIQSKIENIFLFALFNTTYRSLVTNKISFAKVIEEIQFLERHGIPVTINNETVQVYFVLALILGDNLGLRQILGFVESFNANFFCRFCLTKKQNRFTTFNELNCVLRTAKNYDQLLSQGVSTSGVNEKCVFNEIDSFDVNENLIVDPQHDLLEGILRYDLALILYYLIYIIKRFTLTKLNLRLSVCNYGSDNNINKPQPIKENHIKNGYLIMSSAEMLNFVRCLPLIVGPFVLIDDIHWKLLINLRRIVEIVFCKVVHKTTYKLLDVEITEYLTLLSSKYPKHLKPKHHILIHYPRVMKSVGPLVNLTCMRFESKHRDGKITSRSAICRKNVCSTIAIKIQLMLNYRFLTHGSNFSSFETGPTKLFKFCELNNVQEFLHLLPQNDFQSKEIMSSLNRIEYLGHKIQKNCIITIFAEEGPQFHKSRALTFL